MNSTNLNRDPEPKEASPRQPINSPVPTTSASKSLQQAFLMALTLLLMALLVPQASAQRYLPTDIVDPAGGGFRATALNDLGQVSGGYTPPGGWAQPVVWADGTFTLLPLLPGTVAGYAMGLNNVGQVVGLCSTDGTSLGDRACIWDNGTVIELPTVGGTTFSWAFAINDAGTIVGNVFTGTGANPFTEAVIWKGSAVAKLVPPVDGSQTYATAIDNSGRVAVVWSTGATFNGLGYPARWTPDVANGTTGTMVPLTLYGYAFIGRASDINNAGAICGETAVWYGNEGFELPFPTLWGHANSINDAGEVVGDLEAEDFWFAPFVWDFQNGTRDLNTLLSASTPNAYPGSLVFGLEINNAGQILVQAASWQYSLLTPTSQPPALQPPVLNTWVYQGVIQLYWTGMDSNWSYRLKRSTVSGGPYTLIATITDYITGWPNYYSFQDTSAADGVRYYYVVSAVDGLNESADSAEVSAISLAAPTAPSSLTATVPKKVKGVSLTWNQSTSPAIQWNRIYRSTNRGDYALVAQINAGTSYLDNQTTRRTSYSYVVTAVNVNSLESPYSNVVSVRTK